MEESDFSDEGQEVEESREEELDPHNPEDAFAILEKNYNKTLTDLEQNSDAAQYAEDFTKLFEALYATRENEKDLETLTTSMNQTIEEQGAKIQAALKLAAEDKATIDDLKTQINRAWKMADAAHAREQKAQEIIDNLRKQVEGLNAEIEFKNKMNQDSDEMGELSKHKDGLERERDKLMLEVQALTQKLTHLQVYQDELERKNSAADLKIDEISGQMQDQAMEIDRQKRAREKLETDIAQIKFTIEEKDVEISDAQALLVTAQKNATKQEQEIKELKGIIDKVSKDSDIIGAKYRKVQDQANKLNFELEETRQKLQMKVIDVRNAEIEATRLKNEMTKLVKVRESLDKKIEIMIQERDETIEDRNKLRQRIAVFEREIDECKKRSDEDKRAIEVVTREKDALNKIILRQQVLSGDQTKLIQIQEQSKKKLEVELDNFFIETNKQKKMISGLEREKERLTEEQLDLTKKIEDNLEEIRQKKAFIFDLKKDMTEQENKLRQQQNLFEAVRADRNSLQKSLQEVSAECGELRKKMKVYQHQSEQLKEDISAKEQQLNKEETILRKIMKEKENLKAEVNTGLNAIRRQKEELKEMSEEMKRLHKTILDNQRLIREQTKDIESLMNERDILGSQLVRRNDEIALMNEKIKILTTTLYRGETQYDQRLSDIRLLKIEVRRLRHEKALMVKSMHSMVDYKQEVFHLERDLTRARLKCRALEEEVQNPLNIHRWRKLEGSDPDVLDLLQKVQILQKRLLHQSSDAVERERQLKEAERLYLNLKKVVSEQPGPGLQEELNKTQRALKSRGNKLKCLVSELNMAEMNSKEYKSDLQRVTDELNDLKKKYLAEKKANRYKRMASESSRAINQSRSDSGEVRFTGGGFRMSVQQISTK